MRMRSLALAAFYVVSRISTAGAVDTRPVNRSEHITLPQIKSMTVSPLSVIGGATANGTVTLTQPARSGSVTVKLQSSKPAIAAVPADVVIQPGAASANFLVQTYPVTMNPNVVTDPPSADISAQIGTSPPTSVKLTV